MKANIVLGAGFGDEGKGRTVDWLAQNNPDSLVVRFNGGHQAGHTVVLPDGSRHVFSNFGSGTLAGLPTYYSKYCTVHPSGVLKETLSLFSNHAVKPILYVDALCPVTTPYDIAYNRYLESRRTNRHGSCGVGFGTTVKRHLTSGYKFYAQDFTNENVMRLRLKGIKQYYDQQDPIAMIGVTDEVIESFIQDAKIFYQKYEICKEVEFLISSNIYSDLIFEGSQGIMLDQNFGFFPHVTYSHTTSRNAIEILKRNNLYDPDETSIYYVTRCYQTRHGAGPMINENFLPIELKNNEKETNKTGAWQGDFRVGILDVDLLKYAIGCDANIHDTFLEKRLVITCVDQLENEDKIPYLSNSKYQIGTSNDILQLVWPSIGDENLITFNKAHNEMIYVE